MQKQPLQTLKGVGEQTEKLFRKLNITDTEALLHYYPRDYDACEPCVPVEELEEGRKAAVLGKVMQTPSVVTSGRGRSVTTLTIAGESGKSSRLRGFICLFYAVPSKKAWFWSFGERPG